MGTDTNSSDCSIEIDSPPKIQKDEFLTLTKTDTTDSSTTTHTSHTRQNHHDNTIHPTTTYSEEQDDNNTTITSSNLDNLLVLKVPEGDDTDYSNWPLVEIKDPHANDVLYGRGGGTNHHAGNKRYRKIVESRKADYVNAKRLDKPLIAFDIVQKWRSQVPPGRFLKLNEDTGIWNDVGDRKAREKTSQALREKAPLLRKQQEGLRKSASGESEEEPPYQDQCYDDDYIPNSSNLQNNLLHTPNRPPPSLISTKPALILREHSLGRDFLEEGIPTVNNFTWETDVDPGVGNTVHECEPLPAVTPQYRENKNDQNISPSKSWGSYTGMPVAVRGSSSNNTAVPYHGIPAETPPHGLTQNYPLSTNPVDYPPHQPYSYYPHQSYVGVERWPTSEPLPENYVGYPNLGGVDDLNRSLSWSDPHPAYQTTPNGGVYQYVSPTNNQIHHYAYPGHHPTSMTSPDRMYELHTLNISHSSSNEYSESLEQPYINYSTNVSHTPRRPVVTPRLTVSTEWSHPHSNKVSPSDSGTPESSLCPSSCERKISRPSPVKRDTSNKLKFVDNPSTKKMNRQRSTGYSTLYHNRQSSLGEVSEHDINNLESSLKLSTLSSPARVLDPSVDPNNVLKDSTQVMTTKTSKKTTHPKPDPLLSNDRLTTYDLVTTLLDDGPTKVTIDKKVTESKEKSQSKPQNLLSTDRGSTFGSFSWQSIGTTSVPEVNTSCSLSKKEAVEINFGKVPLDSISKPNALNESDRLSTLGSFDFNYIFNEEGMNPGNVTSI